MTSQAPLRCIDQRHSCCCSRTWLISIPYFLPHPFSFTALPLFCSPHPLSHTVCCLLIVPVYLLFCLTFNFLSFFLSRCLIWSCSYSYAVTSQLSPQIDSHAGKHLFSLNPLHNETQADVVQLFSSLRFFVSFISHS